ncbi:hypothetical protein BGZ60DRAFT_515156 [Tricladium varicosporioides]|nr:hypothetical protein BGZ60DRAFT_515156 [Hymenoscyphus varicosporioides]
MPPTQIKQTQNLQIKLDSPSRSYSAGDYVTGNVILNAQCQPFGFVRIVIFGRCKTKITKHTPSTEDRMSRTDVYRGRRALFEFHQPLYDGTVSDPLLGGPVNTFPFALRIPFHPSGYGDHYKFGPEFLPTDGDMTRHMLPSSFYYYKDGSSNTQAFVEYALVAEVLKDKSASKSIFDASTPFLFLAPTTSTPISEFRIKSDANLITIRTLRLLAEHAEGKLTTGQKLKNVFKTSSVPGYTFTLRVNYPTVIQLNHPAPVPFRVALFPEFKNEKYTLPPSEALPQVRITKLGLSLRAMYAFRASSSYKTANIDDYVQDKYYWSFPTFGGDDFILRAGPPGYSEPGEKPGALRSEVLNLGSMLDIRLTPTYAYAQQTKSMFVTPVVPTFATYNIALSYGIRWKIELECAGKKETVDNYDMYVEPCLVLAPAGPPNPA